MSNLSTDSSPENWERFSLLTGFSQEKTEKQEAAINLDISSADDEPLIAEDDQDKDDPVSRFSFTELPTKKLAFIAGGAAIAVYFAWGMFTGMGKGNVAKSPSPSKPSSESVTGLEESNQAQKNREGELMTDVALKEQEYNLKQLNQRGSHPVRPVPRPAPPRVIPVRQVSSIPTRTPYRRVASPPPFTPRVQSYYRPSRYPPLVVPRQTFSAPPPVPSYRSVPTSVEAADPQETWRLAAQLGSYGFGSPSTASTPSIARSDAPVTGEQLVTDDIPDAVQNDYQQQELPILQERALTILKVPMGTSVTGVLERALAWDRTEAGEKRFVIRLQDALSTSDGKVAVPKGSQVLVRLESPSESGLVQLEAESLVVNQDGQLREIQLEPNALSIEGREGEPLIAERLDSGESDSGGGVGGFLVDLAKTAVPFVVGGEDSYGNLYRFGQVEDFFERRLGGERDANRYASRSSEAWFLPAGTEVEIYVNQTLEISY